MRTQQQINEIVRLLLAEYPLADCTLDWRKDYELLSPCVSPHSARMSASTR